MRDAIVFTFVLVFSLQTPPTEAQWEWMHDDDEEVANPVQVFDLDPIIDPNRTSMMFLTFNGSSVPDSFTVCFWLFPAHYNATGIILSAFGHDYFTVSVLEGRIELKIDDKCPVVISSSKLEAHHWYHLCIAVNSKYIHTFLDNNRYEVDITELQVCRKPSNRKEFLFIWLSCNRTGFEFNGKIGHLQLFPRELTNFEMKQLSLCEEGPQDYMEVVTSELIGSGVILEKERAHLCEKPPSEFVALFKKHALRDESFQFCQTLGGRLINQSDDLEPIARQIYGSNDVEGDSFMFWINDSSDSDRGSVLNFNRGDHPECVTFSHTFQCSFIACMIPFSMRVSYKANKCYTLHALPSKGKLIFLSESGYIFSRSECPSVLSESNKCLHAYFNGATQLYSSLEMSESFLGRRLWRCPISDQEFNVTLSQCSIEQFTCSNGQCISLDSKCDGQPQCSDESDENGICHLIDNLAGFQKNICPVANPEVDLAVRIEEVQEISMEQNTMRVVLTVSTTWRDSRISFSNLQDGNISLDLADAENLWYPKLYFANAKYEDNLNMQSGSHSKYVLQYFLHAETSGDEQLRDSFEVRIHEGSDVAITRSIQYLFTFHCPYNFTLYPFDTQECCMQIILKKSPGCIPILSSKNKGESIKSKHTKLSMYRISKAHYCYGNLSTGEEAVILHLLMTRNFGSHLLVTFIPCIILCFLSMLTLTHFELTSFTDRITVTLSLLIVLASIFSQVSSSLPESPHPKLVDIFFSYCIVRVSFVFAIHCSIERAFKVSRQKSQEELSNGDPITDIYHKIAWLSDELEKRENEEKKKKSKVNWPNVINNVGIALTIISDIFTASAFTYVVVSDYNEKSQRMNSLFSSENSE